MMHIKVNKAYARYVCIDTDGSYAIATQQFNNNPIDINQYTYYINSYIWSNSDIVALNNITNVAILKTICQLLLEGYIEIWSFSENI